MKSPFLPFALIAASIVLLMSQAVALAAPRTCGGETAAASDIIDTAGASSEFSTFLTAVRAAGLEDLLRKDGPFTVFVPSNAAFAKLPAGTVEGLLKDKASLKALLAYHVVDGQVLARRAATLDKAMTLSGKALSLRMKGGVLHVDGGRVVQADIQASNGVLHVIDTVAVPTGKKTASR